MPSTAYTERKLLNRLKELLTLGYDEDRCAAELGVRIDKFRELQRKLVEQEITAALGKPAAQIYIEFVLAQQSCLRDLAVLFEKGVKIQNQGVLVQAVRLKSEIYEKIVNKGQELGVIDKDRQVPGEGLPMDDAELRERAQHEVDATKELMHDLKRQPKVVRRKRLAGDEEEGQEDGTPAFSGEGDEVEESEA